MARLDLRVMSALKARLVPRDRKVRSDHKGLSAPRARQDLTRNACWLLPSASAPQEPLDRRETKVPKASKELRARLEQQVRKVIKDQREQPETPVQQVLKDLREIRDRRDQWVQSARQEQMAKQARSAQKDMKSPPRP